MMQIQWARVAELAEHQSDITIKWIVEIGIKLHGIICVCLYTFAECLCVVCNWGLFWLAALRLQWCTADLWGDLGLRALLSNQPSNTLLTEFGSMWRRPGLANSFISKYVRFMSILRTCTHFIATAVRTQWCKFNGQELQKSLSTNPKSSSNKLLNYLYSCMESFVFACTHLLNVSV